MVRVEVKILAKETGTLRAQEARVVLQELDGLLAPACVARLSTPRLTVPCADILGLLGLPSAQGPLEAQRSVETRRRATRHLERALDRLGQDSGPQNGG